MPVGLGEEYEFSSEIEFLRSKISYLTGFCTLHYMVTESDPSFQYRQKLETLMNEVNSEFTKLFPLGGNNG